MTESSFYYRSCFLVTATRNVLFYDKTKPCWQSAEHHVQVQEYIKAITGNAMQRWAQRYTPYLHFISVSVYYTSVGCVWHAVCVLLIWLLLLFSKLLISSNCSLYMLTKYLCVAQLSPHIKKQTHCCHWLVTAYSNVCMPALWFLSKELPQSYAC